MKDDGSTGECLRVGGGAELGARGVRGVGI